MQVNRYQVVSNYTKDLIYSRLASGLLEKLERMNPINDDGERSVRHHQFLTDQLGVPELHEHIVGIIAIMRSVQHSNPDRAWREFQRLVQRSYLKLNTNLDLDLPDTEN